MPEDPRDRFRNAFVKIRLALREAGVDFDAFDETRRISLSEPWPAGTAVEVAGLRSQGAVAEIRVIAATWA
ncbi:hypothetical protein [Jannaschia seohaensis]|uniref:Uncharacterized protein n=1 Tax=Jannaschia seohaensis TaxID=475081 RepID=A0A2Y9A2M6_9RHOB|nr:hypothetical protein [Jannaschia seohaensis]PWJ22416.1 hypothetical protein BCF38_101829 [Jannaschia seohaensis]SSA38694.1 hypothetical protein SAMN05421539_101829 [Jannaschia seohaensis]